MPVLHSFKRTFSKKNLKTAGRAVKQVLKGGSPVSPPKKKDTVDTFIQEQIQLRKKIKKIFPGQK